VTPRRAEHNVAVTDGAGGEQNLVRRAGLASRSPCRLSIGTEFRSTVATERELETATAPVTAPSLSPREREVLTELARGSTYADIASNLYVSENTVKTHISSLYSKLSVSRRSEALAVGRQLHLI
jgi:LuxR family maltose regulon positive regulatory protein